MEGKKYSAADLIGVIKKCRIEERVTEEEARMFTSFLAQYIQLEIKIEEYKFRLKEG